MLPVIVSFPGVTYLFIMIMTKMDEINFSRHMNLMKKTASTESDKKQPTSDGVRQVLSIKADVQASNVFFSPIVASYYLSPIVASYYLSPIVASYYQCYIAY